MFEYVKQIANALSLGMADILPFSIETRKNKEELLALIERFVFQPSISMEDLEDESEETNGEEEGN